MFRFRSEQFLYRNVFTTYKIDKSHGSGKDNNIKLAPAKAIFLRKFIIWVIFSSSGVAQKLCIIKAVGTRKITRSHNDSVTYIPKMTPSPPDIKIKPVRIVASLGEGTFFDAAY